MPIKQTVSSAHGHVKRHYYRVMPNKKSHRVAIWVAIVLYTMIALAQLLYPLDRALPTATLLGDRVGGKTHAELAALVTSKFQATNIELVSDRVKKNYSLSSAGAEVFVEPLVMRTLEYPIWQRYIPFSFLWQPVQMSEYDLQYSGPVLKKFAVARSKEFTTQPINARLSIENGKLQAKDDVSGGTITADMITKTLREAKVSLGVKNSIKLPVRQVTAATTAADFAKVKHQAEAALDRKTTITVEEQVFTPAPDERASWLLISEDAKKQPALVFDTAKFDGYLNTIDAKVGKAAGYTEVTVTNGIETSRVPGAAGRAVTRESLHVAMRDWMIDGRQGPALVGALHEVAPMVRYNKRYTSSPEGLQAYVSEMSRQMNARIAIQQLDGGRWQASARSSESTPSASTYKLFVAKWLFTQMDAGNVTWNDPILDTNVSTCFDRMTIASTNPCAREWLARAGRDNVNNFVWGLGFSHGTTFTHPDAVHTTADDLRTFMIGLDNGSLVGGAYRDRLLHNLTIHPYRSGIPSGSKGHVQNKVGFLWDYVHDAAIVQHPRGKYVMVIMTKGQSYGAIANLTREIERLMYP